jgi:hypothetical protein
VNGGILEWFEVFLEYSGVLWGTPGAVIMPVALRAACILYKQIEYSVGFLVQWEYSEYFRLLRSTLGCWLLLNLHHAYSTSSIRRRFEVNGNLFLL